MESQRLKIYNGQLITPFGIIPKGTIIIVNGIITEIKEGDIEIADAMEINAGGNYIAPGFIDIHIHGGGGSDFMDGNAAAFLKVAETHARYGTTAMVPTTLSSDKESMLDALVYYEEANKKNIKGAQF